MIKSKVTFLAFLVILGWSNKAFSQAKDDFAQKITELMFLVSSENVQQDKVQELLETMTSSEQNPLQIAQMDYSIYPNFQGDKLYYTPYKTKQDDRLSVEVLKKGDQRVYSIDFLLNSSYTIDKGKVVYQDPSYVFNCNLDQMRQLCSKAMTYSKGQANLPDTTVLSCVYVNPKSKKSLMYWVVLTNTLADPSGNTIKEIKIQDSRLWQKN